MRSPLASRVPRTSLQKENEVLRDRITELEQEVERLSLTEAETTRPLEQRSYSGDIPPSPTRDEFTRHIERAEDAALPEGITLGDYSSPESLFRLMGKDSDVLPPVRLLEGRWLESRCEAIRAASTKERKT